MAQNEISHKGERNTLSFGLIEVQASSKECRLYFRLSNIDLKIICTTMHSNIQSDLKELPGCRANEFIPVPRATTEAVLFLCAIIDRENEQITKSIKTLFQASSDENLSND